MQVNFIWYFNGAITGILLTVIAHVLILSSLEIKVESRAAERCIDTGGEITKVRIGGQVICRTHFKR